MEYDYIKSAYGVPAGSGRVVSLSGRVGVIVADCGARVGVVFDDDPNRLVVECHPTWNMEYMEMRREHGLTEAV